MTSFQSACLVIFAILAYLMWVDENVTVYLTLIFKIMRVNAERMLWMIRFHPRNPITNIRYIQVFIELSETFYVFFIFHIRLLSLVFS